MSMVASNSFVSTKCDRLNNKNKNHENCNDKKSVSNISKPIGLVVVESHNHALEHIHSKLRRRLRTRRRRGRSMKNNDDNGKFPSKRKNEIGDYDDDGWIMIHFDSHPDMACPNPSIPAKACFTPNQKLFQYNNEDKDDDNKTCEMMNLYEMLDLSQSGIAEWILPLCLAGGLRHIHWIRSSWADQFHYHHNGQPSNSSDELESRGSASTHSLDDIWNTNFHVGAWMNLSNLAKNSIVNDGNEVSDNKNKDTIITSFLDLPKNAIVKVDLSHPYYHDDRSVVPFNELILPKPVKFTISKLQNHLQNIDIHTETFQKCKENVDAVNQKTETSQTVNNNSASETVSSIRCDYATTPLWALDICLDYYACDNPFLVDLESTVDQPFTLALVNLAKNARFRKLEYKTDSFNSTYSEECIEIEEIPQQSDSSQNEGTNINKRYYSAPQNIIQQSEYLTDSKMFQTIMKNFFEDIKLNVQSLIQSLVNTMDKDLGEDTLSASRTLLYQWMNSSKLFQLFTPNSLGEQLFDHLVQTLLYFLYSLLCKQKSDRCHRDRANAYLEQKIVQLSNESIEALPNLFIPQQQYQANEAFNDDLCNQIKPKFKNGNNQRLKYALQKVKETGKVLRQGIWKICNDDDKKKKMLLLNHPPMIITIARSSEFTSPELVEEIQKALLLEIHCVYCSCSSFSDISTTQHHKISDLNQVKNNCKIKMIFDYGDTEGSTLEEI